MNIKKIIFYISCSLIAMSSCQNDLDYNEFVDYQKEEIFSSFDRTSNFVNNIYGRLDYDFDSFGGAMFASACDEAEYAWTSSDVHDFHNGAWSPTNAKAGMWSTAYSAIRSVNFYLDAAEGRTFEDFKHIKDYEKEMERFERYQYEVRFIRAYFYFNLVRQFGDVPFTTEVLTEAEANELPRTDKQTIFDFIISECDAIAEHLPVGYSSVYKSETGRVGRIAVLALKARTLLYNASPLFNVNNDSQLWEKAAKASKQVIDEAAENNIKLGSYSALWGTDNYKAEEVIFARRIGDLNYLEANNFPIGVEGGKSGNCPTQTLVDAYGMKSTGLSWDEEGSGYDPKNPYSNRDPRFALTIAKNGDEGWPTYNANPLETFVGGLNGSPIAGATPTGYYLKKYLDPSVDLRPGTSNSKRHSWITFRLAEFYLNYAEAMFNLTGSADGTKGELDMSATEAVNVVRARTGVAMPAFPKGLSNADFEKKYIDERMVELAFEGHRFWDVRRWKKGELFKSIDRMILTKNESTGVITYTRETVQRQWHDKMYFFPIPDSELRKNTALTQNTGW